MIGRALVYGGLAALLAVALFRSRGAIRNAIGTQGRILRRGGRRIEHEAERGPLQRPGQVMERAGEQMEKAGE